jgi:hypothetical protein
MVLLLFLVVVGDNEWKSRVFVTKIKNVCPTIFRLTMGLD